MNREEAIGIVKKLYNNSLFLKKDKEAMFTLIPELAENDDERIRKEIIKFIQDFSNPCDPEGDKWIAYLEKQKEHKPAEWSEEDKKMRQDLIAYFTGGDVIHNPGLKFYEAAEWLKSLPERLNLQPKQEWNEEDELTIVDLINYFEGDSLECSTEEMVQRIKSLRPSWKPSKEQLDVLKEASVSWMNEKMGNTKILKSLYEQLKVL